MKASALVLVPSLALVDAFWRMECHGRAGVARLDPLVNPGVASAHVHSIHGSSAFSHVSSNEDLVNGACTSCDVRQDKSAYWHPSLYFKDAATGQYELVPQVGGMLAYYFLNPNPGEDTVTPFPKGFRMIAGTSSRRTYSLGDPLGVDPEKSIWGLLGQATQEALEQRALGFNCLNYYGTAEPSLYRHAMPDKAFLDANCKSGLRAEIMFPSCWNGKDLDSPDHKSHVAYPSTVMDGACPPDFPIKLNGLFYETIWGTDQFIGRPGTFVWSNNDETGLGYHADFMNGWEGNTLEAATAQCTSLSGLIGDCPVFDIQGQGAATQCALTVPDFLKDENVFGPIPDLPGFVGGVPVAAAAPPPPPPPPPAPEASPGVFKDTTAPPESAAPPAPEPAPPAPVTTPPPDPSKTISYEPVSTEYRTVGNLVEVIVWVQPVEYVYDDGTTETVTVSVPAPARAKRDEVEALVAEAIDAQAGRMKRAVVRKVENIKRGVEGEDAKTEEVMREKRRRHWERHVHGSGKHF